MNLKIFACLLALILCRSLADGQNKFDTSKTTKDLVALCKDACNKLQPAFDKIPVLIPLEKNDGSDEFDAQNMQVAISRTFIYMILDTLNLVKKNSLDLRRNSLDHDHLRPDQLEIALLCVLCHEFGHFLQHFYSDTLSDTLGDIHPLLKSQQHEYTCDFISGFTSGKSLWLQIRDKLFKTCADGNRDNLVQLIVAVYKDDVKVLDPAFACLETFVIPYRTADLLIKLGGGCTHGLGISRKNAFDAGIFYSIFDGISRETFEDKAVLEKLKPVLFLLHLSLEDIKREFAIHLTKYLISHKGMTNAISPVLRTYTVPELYTAAFRYCLSLERNMDPACLINLP